WPSAPDADAARYWGARARAQGGDPVAAEQRWRDLVARSPLSYYAMLAARRLDTAAWSPRVVRDTVTIPAAVGEAVARMEALDLLGMDTESRFELDALVAGAGRDSLRLLAVATALRDAGYPSRATTLAFRAIGEGVRDQRAYRLAYPVLHREALEEAARRNRLDPALVAALIRQESSFNPRARSPVGARGLMQLMPDVGRDIARARGYPLWDPALLYEPDVSLELGTSHLAAGLREWPSLVRALAAYNAGGSRVRRWAKKAGAADPEIFAERIPFDETRDYVRIVQRNVEIYRALYGWKAGS
ncbi:MAG TPA: lytic transglycosylase domain-containing protein, partial [Gemmatimonadaceae bacterium]